MLESASPATPPPSRRSAFAGLLLFLLMLVPLALALVGIWIATTLTIFHAGPTWLAIVGAVIVFVVLPLAWEFLADRNQRGGRVRDAILRSSALGTIFVVVLVATHPESTFKALATRGDWFLDGSRTPAAESVRKALFSLANGIEWLNDLARPKPFRDVDDSRNVDPGTTAGWTPSSGSAAASGSAMGVAIPGTALVWPLEPRVHPAIATMPASARASVAAAGAWLKENVALPIERAKAVHDFVATHVRYDYARLRDNSDNAENQSAATVLATGLGVCAGYANLTRDLGVAAGLEFIRISGDARNLHDYQNATSTDFEIDLGSGHAWNAVRIDGRWYLIDTTWDAGSGSLSEGFTAEYRTTYLFAPPEAMLLTHRPDDDRWQLRADPISRAEWMRQPMLRPASLAFGVSFADINRPVIPPPDPSHFRIRNDLGAFVSLQLESLEGDGDRTRPCGQRSNDKAPVFVCDAPDGPYRVSVFARRRPEDKATWLGGVMVERR